MRKPKEINFSELVKLAEDQDFPTVESLGNGLYRLPGGAITGLEGVEMFEKELQIQIFDYATLSS